MTDAAPPAAEDIARLNPKRLRILVLVIASSLIAVYLVCRAYFGTATTEAENAALRQQLTNIQAKLDEYEAERLYRSQDQQVKKSQSQKVAAQIESTRARIAQLEKAVRAWQDTVNALLNSDKGKPIAATSETLKQFHALYQQKRPDPKLPAQLRARLQPLSETAQTAAESKNPLFSFNEGFIHELAAIEDETRRALDLYLDHSTQLQAVLTAAPPTFPDNTPSLSAAVERLDKQYAADQAELIARRVEKARLENNQKLAQLREQQEHDQGAASLDQHRREGQIKLDQLKGQTKKMEDDEKLRLERAALEEAQRRRQEELARNRQALEQKFTEQLPQIKRALAPFFRLGYYQPTSFLPNKTAKKGPMSLKAIAASGGLNQTAQGIDKLYRCVFNDPERAGWVDSRNTDAIVTAQRLLIEFGDLLVEKGMLAE